MSKECFFCDIKNEKDNNIFDEDKLFFFFFFDFPVTKGHSEIFTKDHITSISDLNKSQSENLIPFIIKIKNHIKEKYNPDGINVGLNEGKAAGQSISHFHIHIIPRYKGDVKNPKGGVRNVIAIKADYTTQVDSKFPERNKYLDKKI